MRQKNILTQKGKSEKKEDNKIKLEKPYCTKCGGSFGYFKLKEKKWRCRNCGFLQDIKLKEGKLHKARFPSF
jgi:ribosomal protein S27AE